MPSGVQMSSPAVFSCSTCSWTSRTSDVENPVPGSLKTISVGVADAGEGNGAVGDDGVGDGAVGDTGLAPWQPVSPIANTKTRNPNCVLFVMTFPPTLEAGKGRRNLNAAISTHSSGSLSDRGPSHLFTFARLERSRRNLVPMEKASFEPP